MLGVRGRCLVGAACASLERRLQLGAIGVVCHARRDCRRGRRGIGSRREYRRLGTSGGDGRWHSPDPVGSGFVALGAWCARAGARHSAGVGHADCARGAGGAGASTDGPLAGGGSAVGRAPLRVAVCVCRNFLRGGFRGRRNDSNDRILAWHSTDDGRSRSGCPAPAWAVPSAFTGPHGRDARDSWPTHRLRTAGCADGPWGASLRGGRRRCGYRGCRSIFRDR